MCSKLIARPSKRPHPSAKEKAHSGAERSVAIADKVIAAKIRAENAEREIIKRSTLGLYSLKTKDSPFGIPFAALTDALALAAAKQLLPLSDVYKVGTFCLYDGKCSACSRPVLILDNKVS